jgi:L-threonylcarbamoyladenylate synthase
MVNTELIEINPENPDLKELKKAAEAIRKGKLVAFPTETVYGLGANALDRKAVMNIFRAKGRPADNPLIVHVSDFETIESIARVNEIARKLIDAFFPGPLTLVMEKKDIVPPEVTAGLNTVAVRMPSNLIALKLIELSGVPIAAPSANKAGKPSPTKAEHVVEDLNGVVDLIIDGGETKIGLESTVVDTTTYPVEVLRPGGMLIEEIQRVVEVKFFKKKDVEVARSPGMKYRHYAPDAELIVLYGRRERLIDEIRKLVLKLSKSGKKVGVAVTSVEGYSEISDRFYFVEMGKTPEEVAKNLFDALRELDRKKVDHIIAEGVEEKGIGLAIMNRLKKASNYRVFRV